MNKNTLMLIVLGFAMLVVWIAYTAYSNIFFNADNVAIAQSTNKYVQELDGNMYLDTLNNINGMTDRIKVPISQLSSN